VEGRFRVIDGAPKPNHAVAKEKTMSSLPQSVRVECLNEIQPGKICGAHRLAGQLCCSVCGTPSRTRPVVVREGEPRHRVSVVLVFAFRTAS
jgi:hypothetical protein